MTFETNRETVLLFGARLSARDFAGMAELVTANATWWVVGRLDHAPYAGLHKVADVLELLKGFFGTLDEFAFTMESSIAEGDGVVVEASAAGRLGAATYTNIYLIRFQLLDGKIQAIREFFDGFEISAFIDQLGISASDAFASLRAGE